MEILLSITMEHIHIAPSHDSIFTCFVHPEISHRYYLLNVIILIFCDILSHRTITCLKGYINSMINQTGFCCDPILSEVNILVHVSTCSLLYEHIHKGFPNGRKQFFPNPLRNFSFKKYIYM